MHLSLASLQQTPQRLAFQSTNHARHRLLALPLHTNRACQPCAPGWGCNVQGTKAPPACPKRLQRPSRYSIYIKRPTGRATHRLSGLLTRTQGLPGCQSLAAVYRLLGLLPTYSFGTGAIADSLCGEAGGSAISRCSSFELVGSCRLASARVPKGARIPVKFAWRPRSSRKALSSPRSTTFSLASSQ